MYIRFFSCSIGLAVRRCASKNGNLICLGTTDRYYPLKLAVAPLLRKLYKVVYSTLYFNSNSFSEKMVIMSREISDIELS